MFGKSLPGFAAAMLLGLLFCLSPGEGTPSRRDTGVDREVRFDPRPLLPARRGGTERAAPPFAMPSVEPLHPATIPAPPPARHSVEPAPKPPGTIQSDRALASPYLFAGASRRDGRPDRGVTLRASGEHFSISQKIRDESTQYSHYKHTGGRAGVGIWYDWSIDTTIGLSVDRLDQKVKSLHHDDARQNRLGGYVAAARFDGTVMGRYPLSAAVRYGRVDNRGSGTAGGLAWREDRHRTDVYELSGTFGVPLTYGDDFKIRPEIGFDYGKTKSREYTADWNGTRFTVPERNSTSMTIPLRTEVAKEFRRAWGTFRPRLSVGYTRELDDDAGAARVMNAAAGGMIADIDYAGRELDVRFDKSEKNFYRFGAGLDIRTVGGWEISADYVRTMAGKYRNDAFRLEAARCF